MYVGETLHSEYTLVLRGDLDGNGLIDTDDIFACLEYVLTGSLTNISEEDMIVVSDVDLNTITDTDDVFAILDYILTGSPAITQEFPVI